MHYYNGRGCFLNTDSNLIFLPAGNSGEALLLLALVSMQLGEGLSQNELVFCQPYCQIKTFLYACETESHNFQTLITFAGGRECLHAH